MKILFVVVAFAFSALALAFTQKQQAPATAGPAVYQQTDTVPKPRKPDTTRPKPIPDTPPALRVVIP